ncbi:MAG TPA: hexitol phosphatase HxpB [Acidimicrobiales bacterium]|nr:hexitol phosphatase HxpB [Acidimicrobiales bacterium]
MIQGVIFDLDGLLIDSEPFWRQSEIEILTPLGVPLTDEMCRQTMGTRVDRAIAHWFEKYPWKGPSVSEVALRVFERVVQLVETQGAAMPGAIAAVDFFLEKDLPIAVCSSSWMDLIDAALDRIGLSSKITVRHSAELEEYGKPHPACYLTTASKIGVDPQYCLALEDSFNGSIAAKAALMKVVAVPEPTVRNQPRWGFCDAVIDSLERLDDGLIAQLQAFE